MGDSEEEQGCLRIMTDIIRRGILFWRAPSVRSNDLS